MAGRLAWREGWRSGKVGVVLMEVVQLVVQSEKRLRSRNYGSGAAGGTSGAKL